jgi:enterochelin esterase family protein
MAVKKTTTPIIDGDTATFVWNGPSAPKLMGDFNGWDASTALELDRVTKTQWARTLQFTRSTYMEYVFVRNGRRVRDPNNPNVTPNGIGHFNHFFYMPDAAPTPWAKPAKGVKRGKVTQHVLESKALTVSSTREMWLYAPASQDPVPLLVVYDGQDYHKRALLNVIADNLIAEKRIQPIAIAFIANGGGPSRMLEYGCSEMTLLLLKHVVLPMVAKQVNLVDLGRQPGAYGVLGASMSGLMALYTGLRMPQVFGKVISQSGAFDLGDDVMVTTPLVQHGPPLGVHVWMDAGRYEWLREANHRMFYLLQSRGYDVAYRDFDAGHNYPAWRDELPDALMAHFG